MSGGITQLVAIGAQDAHLVGDPQVSFFRSIYRRHTNFAHVVDRQIVQGTPSSGVISTVRFERRGDMLGYVYLTKKNSGTKDSFEPGNSDIDKVEFLIGGQVIDTQDNVFSTYLANSFVSSSVTKANTQPDGGDFYPLHFFFNEHAMCALPLVSLQYHDVELRITWGSGVDPSSQYECWADYIYLDTAEREEFASNPQELLIYQIQKNIAQNGGNIMELTFNHPVKFLCSVSNLIASTTESNFQLQLNGVDVGEPRLYDPHFTNIPRYFHAPNLTSIEAGGILIPFCLDVCKFQPTGTLNFSRIDSARLYTNDGSFISDNNVARNVYAVNYNVLRIENGMGGLMYAN